MKKILLVIAFGSLLTLAACNGQTSNSEISEVTGEFNYYTNNAPTYLTETATNRVCFTPAQFDTTNDGVMFCFTNTEEALTGLEIENSENPGVATIKIQNLTSDVKEGTKADACFTEGNCEFNEAEFVEVVEFL